MWSQGTWMWRTALCCMLLEVALHRARGRTKAVCCFALHPLLVSQLRGRRLEYWGLACVCLLALNSREMQFISRLFASVDYRHNECFALCFIGPFYLCVLLAVKTSRSIQYVAFNTVNYSSKSYQNWIKTLPTKRVEHRVVCVPVMSCLVFMETIVSPCQSVTCLQSYTIPASGLNMCMSGSATSCEECLLIHPSCAWCAQEVLFIYFYDLYTLQAGCTVFHRDEVMCHFISALFHL